VIFPGVAPKALVAYNPPGIYDIGGSNVYTEAYGSPATALAAWPQIAGDALLTDVFAFGTIHAGVPGWKTVVQASAWLDDGGGDTVPALRILTDWARYEIRYDGWRAISKANPGDPWPEWGSVCPWHGGNRTGWATLEIEIRKFSRLANATFDADGVRLPLRSATVPAYPENTVLSPNEGRAILEYAFGHNPTGGPDGNGRYALRSVLVTGSVPKAAYVTSLVVEEELHIVSKGPSIVVDKVEVCREVS
jgi:hypothetical protein